MISTVLLEFDRAEAESAVHILSKPHLTVALADARALLERVLARSEQLRYVENIPLLVLRDKQGMEGSCFKRICQLAVDITPARKIIT